MCSRKITVGKGMHNYYGDKFKCRMDAVGSYSSSLSTMITGQIIIFNLKCARITFSTFVIYNKPFSILIFIDDNISPLNGLQLITWCKG